MTQPDAQSRLGIRPRTLALLAAFGAFLVCCVLSFRPQVGHNVSRDAAHISRLPNDATAISFYLPGTLGPNTFYEFDTSEQAFLEWVRSFPDVKPAARNRIYRYHPYAPDADRRTEIMIENGYFYEQTEEDRGKHLAYDRDTGRAYYWSHTR